MGKIKAVCRLGSFAVSLSSAVALAWTVDKTEGEASVKKGDIIKTGQTVTTGTSGRVLLKEAGSELWIAGDSRVKLEAPAAVKKKQAMLDVLQGKVRAKIAPQPKGSEFPYGVRTRSVVAGVRGTEFYVAVDAKEEKVCTLEGLVRLESVSAEGKSWDLPAGKGYFKTTVAMVMPEQPSSVAGAPSRARSASEAGRAAKANVAAEADSAAVPSAANEIRDTSLEQMAFWRAETTFGGKR